MGYQIKLVECLIGLDFTYMRGLILFSAGSGFLVFMLPGVLIILVFIFCCSIGMSETSRGLGAPAENNMLGPDFFAFYMRELADLVSEEENLLAFFPESLDLVRNIPGVAGEDSLTENRLDGCNFKQSIKPTDSAPLFSDAIGSQLSDFRKERLKSLARRSLLTFTKEVDEVWISLSSFCSLFLFSSSRFALKPDAV